MFDREQTHTNDDHKHNPPAPHIHTSLFPLLPPTTHNMARRECFAIQVIISRFKSEEALRPPKNELMLVGSILPKTCDIWDSKVLTIHARQSHNEAEAIETNFVEPNAKHVPNHTPRQRLAIKQESMHTSFSSALTAHKNTMAPTPFLLDCEYMCTHTHSHTKPPPPPPNTHVHTHCSAYVKKNHDTSIHVQQRHITNTKTLKHSHPHPQYTRV